MALEFEQSFVIEAAADDVWAYLTDPHRAAGALPGAEVTDKIDDRTFAGTMTVKVGPVSTRYVGKATFEKLDAASRTAEIVGSGRDVRGRGGADLKMTTRVVERSPGVSEVDVVTEVKVSGILAQMGRGMIQAVSDQLFQQFTEAVRAELEQGSADAAGGAPAAGNGPVPEALDGLALGSAVAGSAIRRWLRLPAFWIAVAAAAVLLVWLLRS